MKKADFSNPFANDLADFQTTAASLRAKKREDAASTSLLGGGPGTSNLDITLNGEPIGRRGRQQQGQAAAATSFSGFAATPGDISTTFASAVQHQPTASIVSTPALQGVSSIAGRRHDGKELSPGRQVLFPTALHLSSADSTSVFPQSTAPARPAKGKTDASDDLEWLRDDSAASPARSHGAGGDDASFLQEPLQPDAARHPPALPEKDLLKAQQEKDRQELFAELEAAELEIEATEKRMDVQRIKDETELLDLETNLLTKRSEAGREEEALKAKLEATQRYTEEKLASMASQHDRNMTALRAEVEQAEETKYSTRLKRVEENLKQAQESVGALKEQVTLLRFRSPRDRRSIVAAIKEAAVKDQDEGEESSAAEPEDHLEKLLGGSLVLLKDYCNRRCEALRERVVENIRRETLESAHQVRLHRESAWLYEAMDRKTMLSEHIQQSLQRFLDFFRERGNLKERNIKNVHDVLRHQCEKLRSDTAQKLQQAITQIEARLTLQSTDYQKHLEESAHLLNEQHTGIRKMDASLRSSQIEELETRCGTEAALRRQLFGAQKKSAHEQLHQLRRQHIDPFEELRAEMRGELQDGPGKLQRILSDLKTDIQARLTQAPRLCYDEAATLRMKLEEMEEIIATVHHTTTQEQQQCRVEAKRCEELLGRISCTFSAVFATMKKRRSEQQATANKLDFLRTAWELEHRKALGAPHVVSVAGISLDSSPSPPLEVYADPSRATVAAALEALTAGLRLHATRAAYAAAARESLYKTPAELMRYLRQYCARVDRGWAGILRATLDTQAALDDRAKLEAQLTVVQGKACGERSQLQLEQQELAEERRRLEIIRADAAAGVEVSLQQRERCAKEFAAAARRRHALDRLCAEELAPDRQAQLRACVASLSAGIPKLPRATPAVPEAALIPPAPAAPAPTPSSCSGSRTVSQMCAADRSVESSVEGSAVGSTVPLESDRSYYTQLTPCFSLFTAKDDTSFSKSY
eukprot:gene4306-3121_t